MHNATATLFHPVTAQGAIAKMRLAAQVGADVCVESVQLARGTVI